MLSKKCPILCYPKQTIGFLPEFLIDKNIIGIGFNCFIIEYYP